MADHAVGVNVRPYLPYALAATLWVFALPASVIFALLLVVAPDPPVVVTSGLSVGLTAGASIVGAALWLRHPASADVSFGDLMLWGWYRRKRAEEKLNRGTALLGLDRRGQPVGTMTVTRERQLKVLRELNAALEAKDPYTRGHSQRVERHVYRTGAAMGLSVHDLQELRLAAALHDIGKIRVPDRIIRKPAPLTSEEMAIMQEHSVVGAWMLSHVASADVIESVRYHHERWDGKGYPDGVAGTDIPLFARIIAVADTFDAITSTRPYRSASENERAIQILRSEAGTQFDPMTVEAFLQALPQRVPVTALLMLVPGLGKFLRQLAVAAKRAGAASLAGGVTSATATVMIGAATVVPAIDSVPNRPPEKPPARVITVEGEPGTVDVAAPVQEDGDPADGKDDKARVDLDSPGATTRDLAALEGEGAVDTGTLIDDLLDPEEVGVPEPGVDGSDVGAGRSQDAPGHNKDEGSSEDERGTDSDKGPGKGPGKDNDKGPGKDTDKSPGKDNDKGKGRDNGDDAGEGDAEGDGTGADADEDGNKGGGGNASSNAGDDTQDPVES